MKIKYLCHNIKKLFYLQRQHKVVYLSKSVLHVPKAVVIFK